jgi:micrococcal nuclease
MKRKIRKVLHHSKPYHKVIFLTLFISVVLNIFFLVKNIRENKVTKVIDGDSFELADGRRIRLASINAPEVGRCMSPEAKDTLKTLIEGKIISLYDTLKDGYGRTLANVYVSGKYVNLFLVEKGYARFTSTTNPHFDELRKAYNNAKLYRLGIFSPLCRNDTPINDCLIKGNIRHGEKTYHLPECKNYSQTIVDESYGDRWFCTEEEAIKSGFTKATGCK